MTSHRRLIAATATMAIVLAAAVTIEAQDKAKPVLWAATEIKWTPDPESPDVQTAVLWGDPKTGAYGEMARFKAGMEMPMHHHTADVKGVCVSGTMVIGVEGQPEKELPTGSYLFMPGGVKHTTKCKAGADCVVFDLQPGPADFVPAAPAAAPAPKK